MDHINWNTFSFSVEVEQSCVGLKLFSFQSFHQLSFCIMCSVVHVDESQHFRHNLGETCFE